MRILATASKGTGKLVSLHPCFPKRNTLKAHPNVTFGSFPLVAYNMMEPTSNETFVGAGRAAFIFIHAATLDVREAETPAIRLMTLAQSEMKYVIYVKLIKS